MLEQLVTMFVNAVALLSSKYPILLGIFAAMGLARAIFKPLFTFLHSIADASPSQKDNQILEYVEGSKAYKAVQFVLDLFASVKLPDKK